MDLSVNDLKKISGLRLINEHKLPDRFRKVTIDSRVCGKDDLFFAVKGERYDGHDFIDSVFKKRAGCAVVSKAWYNRHGSGKTRSFKKFSFAVVKDTVKAFGELANVYRKKFIIPVIAIGGSNGKTSVKDYTAYVLSQKYNVLKTEGNLNNQYGVPITLFRLRRKHEIAVVEIGTNRPGEIKDLSAIASPQFGLITNIGKEHLRYLGSIRGVTREECALLEYIEKNFGTFFLNSDDKILVRELRRYNVNKYSYGTGAGSPHVKGKLKGFKGFYPEIEIISGKVKLQTRLRGIGKQSFLAALAAAAAGFYFEVPAQKIKRAISEYAMESGKRNMLINANGIWLIDDSYNSNPGSVKAALENLKAYNTGGEKYVVLADMLELGKLAAKEHFETGIMVRKMGFKNLYTYGRSSFKTFSGAKGIKNNFHFKDKKVMASVLKLRLKKGDIILVKGSRSMKMETIIEDFVS